MDLKCLPGFVKLVFRLHECRKLLLAYYMYKPEMSKLIFQATDSVYNKFLFRGICLNLAVTPYLSSTSTVAFVITLVACFHEYCIMVTT